MIVLSASLQNPEVFQAPGEPLSMRTTKIEFAIQAQVRALMHSRPDLIAEARITRAT